MTSVAALQSSSAAVSGGAATSTVDALLASSRTAGVVNTRELAEQLAAGAANDPDGGAALYQAVSDRLGPVDQHRLAADHQAATAAAAPKAKTPSVSDFKLDGANAADKAALQKSVTYLEQTKLGKQVIQQAEKNHATIHIIRDGNDRALGNEVWWDPNSALTTTKGGVQSPALGLVHELAHTEANPKTPIRDLNNNYDNTEERRVITQIETPIARQLGEGTRTDHRGGLLEVKDPTYHKPNPPAK
jgi:hypothetical protein